jgi:hypothetical protein
VAPPNPDRSLGPLEATSAASLYPSTPAPMGVSDLGVDGAGSYNYTTPGFEGALTLTSFSAFTPSNATSVAYAAPNWVLLQLNAVAVNVSYPGSHTGTFWVQNTVHFNGTTVELQDNVWNFSGPSANVTPSTILAGAGTHGHIITSVLQLYAAVGSPIAITPPLTIDLYSNITETSAHATLTFGYWINNTTVRQGGTYDTLRFNGTVLTGSPPQFLVKGGAVNPAGLLDDAEFVIGGNGGGANANVFALNAAASLLRRPVTGLGYLPIRSAFDFGPDSAETALGVAVTYNGTTAFLNQGPSFLYGLWNTSANALEPSASPGWIDVQLTTNPSYALVFATNLTRSKGSVWAADYSFAPSTATGVVRARLPPPPSLEPYVFTAWANGYANGSLNVSSNFTGTLVLSSSPGILDAPVYLLSSTEASDYVKAHVTQTGFSTPLDRLWINASKDALAPPFLRVNDFDYPTFELFAETGLTMSVTVDDFLQTNGSFTYTNESGANGTWLGWGQGYFFYGGSGRFVVENLTTAGVLALAHKVYPNPPSTVEFYGVSFPTATTVLASNDSVGVTLVDSTSGDVSGVRAITGAEGVAVDDSTGTTVSGSSASGYDASIYAGPSSIADVVGGSLDNVSNSVTQDLAYGVLAQGTSGLGVSDLIVNTGAIGLLVNDTTGGSMTTLNVEGGGLSSAGFWTNSTSVAFTSVDIIGGGLDLSNDSSVTLTTGTASGLGSSVVASFEHSNHGTFRSLEANDGANAAILEFCSQVNASEVDAVNASVGVLLANVTAADGSGFSSSNLSVGLILENATGGRFTDFSVTDVSLGAYVANATGTTLENLTASNATLGIYGYFFNASLVEFPIAAADVVNDSSVTVGDVAATRYPFAVVANSTKGLSLTDAVSRYGGELAQLFEVNSSNVKELFAYEDVDGISVANCTGLTISDSTFEFAGSLGLELANGTGDTFEDDNFVGNDNSSVLGLFNGTWAQVWANNSTSPVFAHDYWADRSGGAYVINATAGVKDGSPLGSFYGSYLKFVERDLNEDTNWSVLLGTDTYTTNYSLFFVPGWALANGPWAFAVPSVRGYPPPDPALGVVDWTGASTTETIYFGTPPSPGGGGLPLWVYAGIGGGAVAAAIVVVALLAARSRRRPPARRSPPTGDPGDPFG